MVQTKNIRLTALSGAAADSAELSEDYRAAVTAGPFSVGALGIYYREGLKKLYVPLEDIDHVFTRVEGVDTHCCCGGLELYIYYLVVCGGGKELIAMRTEKESYVDSAQALLRERIPGLRVGFKA